MITNMPTPKYTNHYLRSSVQRGAMAIRPAQAPSHHYYPPVMVDYCTMPRSRRIHHTNYQLYTSEYVHVPAPHQQSQYFVLESDMDHQAGDYGDVPVFLPHHSIAYTDDIDVDTYNWEADTVYID
jgi:hypothetical protein